MSLDARSWILCTGLAAAGRVIRTDFRPIYGLIDNAGLGTSGLLSNLDALRRRRRALH
jgi:hypothetical protein